MTSRTTFTLFKSTAESFLQLMQRRNIQASVFLESNLPHQLDYLALLPDLLEEQREAREAINDAAQEIEKRVVPLEELSITLSDGLLERLNIVCADKGVRRDDFIEQCLILEICLDTKSAQNDLLLNPYLHMKLPSGDRLALFLDKRSNPSQ